MQEYQENPHVSAWVMAHAGSGKTYALVRRVIALLLAGADPRTIWCVTYTNIAAAEMLARTQSMLETLSAFDDTTLQAELSSYLGIHTSADDVARLRAVSAAVKRPGQQIICTTMHGLCQRILRIFALELGISPGFTALDAEAQRSLMQRACDSVCNLAMQETHPAAAALRHVSQHMGSYRAVVDQLQALMHKRDAWQQALRHFGSYEAVNAAIYNACSATAGQSVADLLRAAHAATPPALREVASVLRSGSDTDAKKTPVIDAWLNATGEGIAHAWEAYRRIFLTAEGTPQKKLSTKILTPDMLLGALFYREQQRVIEISHTITNAACAADSAHMATLLYAASEAYQELKAQSDALDFDDMILFVQKLISDPQSLGYVMSKLDYRVEHILVDEAQDTSPVQWEILSTLIEDLCAAAGSHAHGLSRSAFVVGDTKQSIYSFQGAAPWMMQQKRQEFAEMFTGHGKGFVVANLAHARRSVPKILQFVDAMGENPSVRSGWMEEAAAHQPTRSGAGHIALWPLITHDEKTERTAYQIPTEYSLGTRAPRKLAEQIASTIKGWVDNKRPLSSSGAPVTPGDIMIIVRRRGTLVPALIRALETRGIAVAGMDRVRLSEHVFVQDVLALIAWCFQPNDDVSLAQVMRSPIGGFSEEALFEIAYGRSGNVWEALNASADHAPFVQMLEQMKACMDQPIYPWLVALLYSHGILTRYRARLGNEVQEIIDEVLHYAMSLEATPDALLLAFMMRMRASHAEVKREALPGDQVRILTVHGAKGLESPIVILADMTELPSTAKESCFAAYAEQVPLYLSAYSDAAKQSPVWQQAKAAKQRVLEQEYYRELYVAITRAEDELYLCSTKNARSTLDGSWYDIARSTLLAMSGVITADDGVIIWADDVQAQPSVQADVAHISEAALPDWLRRKAVPKPAPLLLTPSRFGLQLSHAYEEEPSNSDGMRTEGDARDYGNALHALLEWVRADTPAHLIAQALAASGLSEKDQALLSDTITRLWAHEGICALLSLPSQNEQAIAAELPLGSSIHHVYGIIDRLIITEHEVIVLDYKTTLQPPPAGKTPAHYVAQMGLYRAVLMRMYPNHTVRCALLWSHIPRLDWLTDHELEAMLQALTNNLGADISQHLDVSSHAA